MPFDSDVALLGTGVAPLVAASHFLSQGKSVLLLNPNTDFFLEDSELPIDPMIRSQEEEYPKISLDRIIRNHPEHALNELRPDFPGAVEFWSGIEAEDETGFRDLAAPHVRSRSWLWVASHDDQIEDLYIETSDGGLKPQILEGLQATRRFPGASATDGLFRGLFLPRLCDVDVIRYRNGLLEFVRERLGSERVVCGTTLLELMPGGVRFYFRGQSATAKLRDGILVFWTPRLTSWVLGQARKTEVIPKMPEGIRLWEQWSLVSKKNLDAGVVGIFKEMAVWAEAEGRPEENRLNRLAVLRSGPRVESDALSSPQGGLSWASAESLSAVSSLCHSFLGWNQVSVRSMTPKAIFEWKEAKPWVLSQEAPGTHVIPECDGPLSRVVGVARSACSLLSHGGEEE